MNGASSGSGALGARVVTGGVERAGRWIYRGVWGVLVKLFRVPDRPPTLPTQPGETPDAFQPALGYLHYMLFKFFVGIAFAILGEVVALLAITVGVPLLGLVLLVPGLILTLAGLGISFLAIYLRYDTTWYVMTNRSIRLRRGVWTIHETTITFENVQNVTVSQGPVQRYFGIANVLVETAGGGAASAEQAKGGGNTQMHRGLIEGVADAHRIRDLILSRLKQSRTTGLGDEHHDQPPDRHPGSNWTQEHLAVLREIREAAAALG